jgi:hypothetical protein
MIGKLLLGLSIVCGILAVSMLVYTFWPKTKKPKSISESSTDLSESKPASEQVAQKVSLKTAYKTLDTQVKEESESIFDDQFREELKNRGRLHFEKVINENAMFLQQDLRLTTSQVNDYMKVEIKKTLQDEFAKYEQSISDAKTLAIESIEKTKTAIEQQRQILEQQLTSEVAKEKDRILVRFDKNMADIVNHYIIQAIGQELDISSQLEFILGYMNENKAELLEDIGHGV